MKRALLAISLSAGLACVAHPALAEDRAVIEQHGSGSTVRIEQIASMGSNAVQVTQGGQWGNDWGGSQVRVTQQQVGNSSVDVRTSGNNVIDVNQRDGYNLKAEVVSNDQGYGYGYGSDYNRVQIDQSGNDAFARVEQMHGAAHNQASVVQLSQGGVMAEVFQHGHMNQASIMQSGSNLSAGIMQSGSNNQASIQQRGY